MVKKFRSEKGFTLLELMVVIVILGLLAAVVLPRLIGRGEEARVATAKAQIHSFNTAIGLFKLHTARYPSHLEDLVRRPSSVDNWKGPYLDSPTIPKDPWGREYVYRCRNGEYDIICYGADGREGGSGYDADITNHNLHEVGKE